MTYKLSRKSRERLQGVLPIIIEAINNSIGDSPYDFGIPKDGGLRADERQRILYSHGREAPYLNLPIITWLNGIDEKSDHQAKEDSCGYAVDIFCYDENGKATWDLKYLEPVARHIQKHCALLGFSMSWGQDLWGKDGAHLQFNCYLGKQ